jgi:hypothetical protein
VRNELACFDWLCAHETPGAACHISVGMGLGWQIIVHNGVTIVDHSGSDAGVSKFAFIPSKHVAAVMAKMAPRSLARSSVYSVPTRCMRRQSHPDSSRCSHR